MWDKPTELHTRIARDPQCPKCGHARHTYLPCSDTCPCASPITSEIPIVDAA